MDKIVTWILRIFLILLGLVIIYQLVRKILGGSWELETIMLALLVANVGYSFYLGNQISELKGWTSQFEKRFEALETEFQQAKRT